MTTAPTERAAGRPTEGVEDPSTPTANGKLLLADASTLASMLDSIQGALREWFSGDIAHLPGRQESWAFAPLDTAIVLEQLRLARGATPARRPRFLDCGSGFGFVGGLAYELGFDATGVEIEPSYIEVSRRLFSHVPVVEADLLSYDGYRDFDVVYYYRPFDDDEVADRFERRIEEALRPGGVVCANDKVSDHWREGPFDLLHTNGGNQVVLQKHASSPGRGG